MGIPNASGASFPIQAAPDSKDFEIWSAGFLGYGVASGCACTPASSGVTLGVAVASGSVHVGSKTAVAVTGATVTPGAASGSNPRIDLVVADNAGALSVVAGTAAAQPEFPTIPASRTVLCAVVIPTSATSITAGNIVDKRLLVDYQAPYGTTSTTAARGDHLHSGEYASTDHGDTHAPSGSDPPAVLGAFTLGTSSGDGYIIMPGQSVSNPPTPSGDLYIHMYARWLGYRPVPTIESVDRWLPYGDEITGPAMVWRVHPGTGTTAPTNTTEVPSTNTASTWSTPTSTTTLGVRQSMNTSTTSGNAAFVSTTDLRYVRGDNVQPWCGYYFHCRVVFDHANGYGSTLFFAGLTDQTAATSLATADPAGHRHGFRITNGSGNFLLTSKNGTTETTMDSGIAFATSKVFDFYVYCRPSGGYAFGHVINRTDALDSGSLINVTSNMPGQTNWMRAVCGIATTTTAIRGMSFHRAGCEVAA